jgi:protocatechuate 3,4-dioxygenase alpha subunit
VTGPTPSQTIGPFFSVGLNNANLLVRPGGEPVQMHGRVLDGAAAGVPDAVVEIFHPAIGFGRCLTGADGGYRFVATKPPATTLADGRVQAPHFEVSVFARGLLQRVATRLYFAGDPANDADPVLASIADERARSTLVAAPAADDGSGGHRFDVRLQGPEETVFLAL